MIAAVAVDRTFGAGGGGDDCSVAVIRSGMADNDSSSGRLTKDEAYKQSPHGVTHTV